MIQTLLSKLQGDRTIWAVVALLGIISMLAVYSASSALTLKASAGISNEYYLLRQAALLGFGFVIMFLAHRVNYSYYSRIAQLMLYISIPLLLITLLVGTNIHDARRWLTVPVLGISFQTSDLAKLALIMYTARMLSKKQHVIKNFDRAFLPIAIPMLTICMLIVPADLSTASLLFFTCLILMFIGRISLRHIGLTLWLGLSVLLFYVGISSLTNSGRLTTWKSRIESFVNKTDEEDNYQVMQAKIAVANGGLIRFAPGKSYQRNFLPHPYSDFIYAIIIEEYGLLGGGVIVLLYLVFLYRSIRIFARSPGAFGALLAVGLSISLVIQAMMNMAVTVNLLPVTGLTLPFVSMGVTSLIFTSLAIGIILSVSRHIEEVEKNEALNSL